MESHVQPFRRFSRGIYRTSFGNSAFVSGPNTKSAYDLDAGERIPISEVTTQWLREAEPHDVHK